jgi:hypothetical protein
MSDLKVTIPLAWAPGEPGEPHGTKVQEIIIAMEAIGHRFADYGETYEKEQDWIEGEVVDLCFWAEPDGE